ncbi:hypothetical protein FMM75_19470 [Lachnospiraceae bacterium MD335]|nr:hypothetical protein [Lachnospiraceae bacterium MD335]
MKDFECVDRNDFSNNLANKIINYPSNFYQFIGKNGSGKKYVIENLEILLKKKCDIYRIVSDTVVRKNQSIPTHTFNVAFSLSNFIGISLSAIKNDSLKINYIISNLKALTLKKILLITALDYDLLPTESRDFIAILVSNKAYIEKKVKKSITVIITSNSDYFIGRYNAINIQFRDYERKDIYNFLINECGYLPSHISNEKLNQICNLCGSNFNLVKSYSSFILDSNAPSNSIEALVDTKLNYYIQSGRKYNLSKDELKSILYVSSLSVNLLTPEMISYVTKITEENTEKGFECAVYENFLEKESPLKLQINNFLFISQEEKEYLCRQAYPIYLKKVVDYYVYLSEIAEDEYFERSQYLLQYYGELNKNVFALLGLAISKSFLLNDCLVREKVITFYNANMYDEDQKILFFNIIEAYEEHQKGNYRQSNEILHNIDYTIINIVLVAELKRLEFKNGYLGHISSQMRLNGLSKELQAHLEQKMVICTDFLSKNKDEKIISLKIIFDLAPFILDSQNDRETFRKLYDDSLILVQYINNHFVKKSFAEYVINVFNRKAFLFAPPSIASVYYEQATAYFKENYIWDEYAITLASKAGNEIALHRYDSAVNNCEKAISILNRNSIEIAQSEKIYNNLYIANFLYYEEKHTIEDNQIKAAETVYELEKLLTEASCGMNHVIMTNMASLDLYANNENDYRRVKHKLETSLKCKDVSNITLLYNL